MTINNISVASGTISSPIFISAGYMLTITPSTGATATPEYTLGDAAAIKNGTAIWAVWPKGAVTAKTTDIMLEAGSIRITSTAGSSTLQIDSDPSQDQLQPFLTPFASIAISAQGYALSAAKVSAYNFDSVKMRKWRQAKARVLAKTGRGVLMMLGDSREVGFGATGAANFVGARAKNRAAQIAAYFNANGLPAHTDNVFCDGNINSVGATVPQYDPRVTLGAGWVNSGAFDTVQWTGFGIAFSNLTTTNTMSFTPDNQTDTADIYYLTRPGFGVMTVSVGGNVIATMDGNVAQSIKKLTISYPRGANTLTFTPTTVGNGVFVYGMDCYDSTIPKISVWTCGNSGGGVQNMIFNSFPWEGTQPFKSGVISVDATIINIGVNDANNGMSIPLYSSRLSTIVDNVQTGGGNCILNTFSASSLASWPASALPRVQTYWDAITAVGIAKGIPLVDHATRFGSYEVSNPLGLYADTLHPNGVAMADQAQIDGATMLYL